jgi:hypothetical protein
MSRKSSKQIHKSTPDPLPEHFNSLEEAANFWDSHDSADYDEYFEDVEAEVDIKRRTYLISIDGPLYDKVQAIARKKHVALETLVNRWIEEKAS